jgi:heme/copper-type cytochrome/quinol oxidase subunit 3
LSLPFNRDRKIETEVPIAVKKSSSPQQQPEDWRRFFTFSTDRKVIGIQYLVTSFFFFLIAGFHGLHVLTGVLLQSIMLVRSFIPGNYDKGEFGVESTSLFWHFVDVIWIILFLLIYVWQ